MPKIIEARFGAPEDITRPGDDRKSIRFPYVFVDEQFVETPRQTAETKNGRITVNIIDGRVQNWQLSQPNLNKVLFQIAKEHLEQRLRNTERIDQDITVNVNTKTHTKIPPYDPQFIEEPDGATIQFEVKNSIGFQ